jgi:hypothetical protein
MDAELAAKLQEQDAKLTAILESVEKTRRYFQITLWVSVLFFVLPLIGLVFAVPYAMNSYVGALGGDYGAAQTDQLQQLQELLNDL